MNTAHIIIQIMESPDGSDMQVNLSYSGGEGLQREDSRAEFDRLTEELKQHLTEYILCSLFQLKSKAGKSIL